MKNTMYKVFIFFVLFFIIFYLFSYVHKKRGDIMTVYFLDVGQGDSILIEAPGGSQLLIDAGLNSKVLKSLGEVLPFFDRSIDTILISHPDADHIGGFPEILSTYKVFNLIHGNIFKDNLLSLEIKNKFSDSDISVVESGDIVVIDSKYNIYLEIFHPSDLFHDYDKNDASLVMRLVYGEVEFMFSGDASIEIENYITTNFKEKLESDVLKIGHHGSRTSTSDLFLGFVRPHTAVISVGSENKFGHPHEEVLKRLEEFGVNVLQTKELGTIVLETDGEEFWLK